MKKSYKGSYRGYVGYDYHPVTQSVARISPDGALLSCVIGQTPSGTSGAAPYLVKSGRGYGWDADEHGVRLVRLSDGADYHPTSDEARAGRASIVAALRERADVRKKTKLAAKRDAKIIKAASKGGIWVCLQDSIDAGNCVAGSNEFARRNNLDLTRHYRAEDLPREGEDNSRRVALAVLSAARRQARDMERGYSEL
jgi:hypothetical protein